MPTTWNPADLLNITLSGTNNLTATRSGSGGGGVRSLFSTTAGKYYFEYTGTTWIGSTSNCVGVANSSATLSGVGNAPTNACVCYESGLIYNNNSNTGSGLGQQSNGSIIGVAIDLSAKLIWFRSTPAGNWNASGTANPATGAGGISITTIAATAMYGLVAHAGVAETVTANFGDSAFNGAVPSGFTAGFGPAPTAGPRQSLIT
jgi:hypothetical protein